MDNQQPIQTMPPTNDFLNRMDMANGVNTQPEPPKKKFSTPLLIGIIVGVVAIIGVVVAVIMMNSNSNTQPTVTATTTEWPDDLGVELSEEIIARNEIRVNDLAPLKNALEQYQLNNGDAVPSELEQWEWMIRTYIPNGLKDMATGENYTVAEICKFGEVCGANIDNMTWEMNQHKVYVMLNSACKGETKDDLLVSYTGKRKAAMFAILEGSQSFLCVSN